MITVLFEYRLIITQILFVYKYVQSRLYRYTKSLCILEIIEQSIEDYLTPNAG